jgi:hypothetical protein
MYIGLHISTALPVWLDLLITLVCAVTATYLLYLLLILAYAVVEFLRTRTQIKSSQTSVSRPCM